MRVGTRWLLLGVIVGLIFGFLAGYGYQGFSAFDDGGDPGSSNNLTELIVDGCVSGVQEIGNGDFNVGFQMLEEAEKSFNEVIVERMVEAMNDILSDIDPCIKSTTFHWQIQIDEYLGNHTTSKGVGTFGALKYYQLTINNQVEQFGWGLDENGKCKEIPIVPPRLNGEELSNAVNEIQWIEVQNNRSGQVISEIEDPNFPDPWNLSGTSVNGAHTIPNISWDPSGEDCCGPLVNP